MALAPPQQNFISDIGRLCRTLLEMQGDIQQINTLYHGTPDWDVLITDEEIDGIPLLQQIGLTGQDVADAIFQLNAVYSIIQTGNLPAVTVLSKVV